MIDVIEINGPSVPNSTEIFQVTLPNGTIMTRAFDGIPTVNVIQQSPMVGENGEILFFIH